MTTRKQLNQSVSDIAGIDVKGSFCNGHDRNSRHYCVFSFDKPVDPEWLKPIRSLPGVTNVHLRKDGSLSIWYDRPKWVTNCVWENRKKDYMEYQWEPWSKYPCYDPCVYLLQEREFVRLGETTYKIGHTTQPRKRLKAYPNGSVVLTCLSVKESNVVEAIIIDKFNLRFERKWEYGSEYFFGDKDAMIKLINKIVEQSHPKPKAPIKKASLSAKKEPVASKEEQVNK